MEPSQKLKMTPDEYLEFEKKSEIKHEYFNGEIFAMTGARPNHNRIQRNVAGILWGQMAGKPCEFFLSDQRVKIEALEKYTYPDVSIACDNIQFEDDPLGSLTNPIVIIEILSNTTEAYDRGMKFAHYRLIDTLQEYVLISQDHCQTERYLRNRDDSTWILSVCNDMAQKLTIESIQCELPLADVYQRVQFIEDISYGDDYTV